MSESTNITVIIPFYRAEKYLAEAVESVLNQSVKPVEIILIDDGSPDNSIAVAKRYQPDVTILRQQNQGAAAARNTGLKKAKGDLIAFLDADDYWKPDTLEYLSNKLLKDESLEMVFGSMKEFISSELEDNPAVSGRKCIATGNGFMVGTALIRKEVFDSVGWLNETLRSAEFIDWVSRAKDWGVNYKTDSRVVLCRRIHLNNRGFVKQNHYKDYTKMLRAALARKKEKK